MQALSLHVSPSLSYTYALKKKKSAVTQTTHACTSRRAQTDRLTDWDVYWFVSRVRSQAQTRGKKKKNRTNMARVNLQLAKKAKETSRDVRSALENNLWCPSELVMSAGKKLFLEMLFQMFVAIKSWHWDWKIPTSARVTIYNCTHHL